MSTEIYFFCCALNSIDVATRWLFDDWYWLWSDL